MTKTTDKPLAARGLNSYRYRGPFGWIMVAATDVNEALLEVARSTDEPVNMAKLEKYEGGSIGYLPVVR